MGLLANHVPFLAVGTGNWAEMKTGGRAVGRKQVATSPRPGSVLARVKHPIHRWVDLYKFIGQAQSPSLPFCL